MEPHLYIIAKNITKINVTLNNLERKYFSIEKLFWGWSQLSANCRDDNDNSKDTVKIIIIIIIDNESEKYRDKTSERVR